MNSNSTGAQFEILIDGKPRSWRDVQETAFEAARYLKDKTPTATLRFATRATAQQSLSGWVNEGDRHQTGGGEALNAWQTGAVRR